MVTFRDASLGMSGLSTLWGVSTQQSYSLSGFPKLRATSDASACKVYLVEEDQTHRRARKKAGGNSSRRYTEGWIEFEDKRVAKGELHVSSVPKIDCVIDQARSTTRNLSRGAHVSP